ncbi:hypothetical protein BDZ45DRAFT_770120 [Acephala macrosclerotiorum]|nr:hypothetical protein BDZ45DRAFT_770120 [Acephala macrosclerotiorum]
MASPTKVQFPSFMLTIGGEPYTPSTESPNRKGVATVAGYPMTGVKEQTAAPDPHQLAEDVKAAVGYLTTLQNKIDPERIGVLGICANGGYTSHAAQSDARIKALATNDKESPEAVAGALKVAGEWWTSEAKKAHGDVPAMFPTDPDQVPGNADSFFKDAAVGSSYDLMVSYDSFNFQHLISPRPLLMIAGTKAQTLHSSEKPIEAVRNPKDLFIIEGKNRFDLYDDLEESSPKVVDFFGNFFRL